jgi:hypothetical protein
MGRVTKTVTKLNVGDSFHPLAGNMFVEAGYGGRKEPRLAGFPSPCGEYVR